MTAGPSAESDFYTWLKNDLKARIQKVDRYLIKHIIEQHGFDVDECNRTCNPDDIVVIALAQPEEDVDET